MSDSHVEQLQAIAAGLRYILDTAAQMLAYGCTRLEIGLQSIFEDVARDTNRGHTVAAVGECFRMAKDAGFKVGVDGLAASRLGLTCMHFPLELRARVRCPGLYIRSHPSLRLTLLRMCGQVVAHMMPDLPNVGWERDVESFAEFFENPAFRTDGLKLYPTLVIRGTGLYELWKAGLYRNYDPSLLIELVRRLLHV